MLLLTKERWGKGRGHGGKGRMRFILLRDDRYPVESSSERGSGREKGVARRFYSHRKGSTWCEKGQREQRIGGRG